LTLLAVLSISLFCASKAKAAPTPITSSACNNFITASGAYILQTDIGPCAPGDVGIWISVSNVNLYMNGHTLNGSTVPGNCDGSVGVFAASFDETTVISGVNVIGPGKMSNWQIGLASTHSTKSSVSFTKVTADCSAPVNSYGIVVDGTTSRWTFLGNVVQEPGNTSAGLDLGGSGHYVAGNSVNDTLEIVDCTGCVVFGNFATNDSGGIYVSGGSNNQILANTTENNTGFSGILLTGGTTGNLVSLNRSLNNTPYDMEDDSPGCGTDKWERNTFKTANKTCIH
jgi:parallel beta-helix repeat protein